MKARQEETRALEMTLGRELRTCTEILGPPAPGILDTSLDFSVMWVNRFLFGWNWLELKESWLYV